MWRMPHFNAWIPMSITSCCSLLIPPLPLPHAREGIGLPSESFKVWVIVVKYEKQGREWGMHSGGCIYRDIHCHMTRRLVSPTNVRQHDRIKLELRVPRHACPFFKNKWGRLWSVKSPKLIKPYYVSSIGVVYSH